MGVSCFIFIFIFFFKLENVRQLKLHQLHHLSQWIRDGLEGFIVCFQHAYSQCCKQTAGLLGDSVAFIWLLKNTWKLFEGVISFGIALPL